MRVLCTGALTNVALLVSLYPEVLPRIEIVLMGGAMGVGNTGPVMEFNIQVDLHQLQPFWYYFELLCCLLFDHVSKHLLHHFCSSAASMTMIHISFELGILGWNIILRKI